MGTGMHHGDDPSQATPDLLGSVVRKRPAMPMGNTRRFAGGDGPGDSPLRGPESVTPMHADGYIHTLA